MFKVIRLLPAAFCAALLSTPSIANAQTDLGAVAVGASTSATITVTVPKASSFTAINVLTWGATGLDFTQTSGGTCATGTSYSVGQTCTVNVQFAPQYAGVRMGAVTLANPGSNTFATTFIQGTGTAPQMVFEQGVASAIYPTLSGNPLAPNPTTYYQQVTGLAIDGADKLSIASQVLNSSGTNIAQGGFLEVPAGSSTATFVPANGDASNGDPGDTTLTPTAVRVDGAGDRILNDADHTISLPPGATVGAENTIYYLNAPAVDGKGNVYLFDGFSSDNELEEYAPTNFDGYVAPVAYCSPWTNTPDYGQEPQRYASAQAVDAAGNVFIVYFGLTKVTASQLASKDCFYSQAIQVTQGGTAYTGFNDLAFDGAGDMLLADSMYNRISDAPAGGGEALPITAVVDGKSLKNPTSLALDHTGNIYVLDAGNSRVVKIDRTQQAPLSFATAPVNTISSDGVKPVVIKNAGTAPLTFSSIVFPPDFPEQVGGTNPCSTSTPLASGASCNLNVTFKPLSATTLNETVTITDNTLNQTGTTQSFNVSGTGVADELTISSTSLSFGSEPVGYSTATQTVTVTNHGSAITFSSIALTGASAGSFVSSNTCGTTLAANATCTIGVRFAPTVTGAATAAVTLTDNAADSPQSIALNGTATTAPTASVSLSATSLAFGNEPVGSSTATQNVNVTNTSANTLYFKSIALSGTNAASFITSNTCGVSIAAGATCRIGVRFLPTVAGTNAATLTLTDNASTPTQSISLSGTGIALTLSPSSINFGPETAGNTYNAQTVTVTNTSHVAVSISSIALTGTNASQFAETTNCGTSLAAGASCQISVTFSPTTSGDFTAAISVSSTGSASPQTVSLSGTGVIQLSIYPSGPFSFGNEPVGVSTATQSITLFNFSNVAVHFTSIALAGTGASSFVTSNTCGTSLAPDTQCQIGVRFVPTALGSFAASITVTSNATGSPNTIALSGTGVAPPAASVSLSASSLSFGNETVGVSTATQNVTVTNTSSNVLYFKSITLGGANASSFITSNTCGGSIAAGATCRIGARFVPTAVGAASAAITLTDNAATPTQTISLSGTGQ